MRLKSPSTMTVYEPAVEVPKDVAIVAMDLQDIEEKELSVNMVRRQDHEEVGSCLITVDSGADISVLPKDYAGVGERQEGDGSLKMVDAQGKKIPHSGMTRAKVRMAWTGQERLSRSMRTSPWQCATSHPMCRESC